MGTTNVQLAGQVDSIVPTTILWTVVPPSGSVTFVNSANPDTIAHITAAGTYTLRLTATTEDSLSAHDDVVIQTLANTAPVPDAGPDLSAFTNVATNLAGSATYTGFHPPVTYASTDQGATGHVNFVSNTSANTNVTIDTAGTYTLRLTASDSAAPPLSAFNETTVTVQTNPGTHYVSATAANPSATLSSTDVEYRVDLSLAGAPTANAWWTNMVGSAGEDIRVTDSSNNPLPFDVVYCSKADRKGLLVYKRPVSTTGAAVRIYTGGTAVKLAVNDTYGQYNAYRSDCLAFYPEGGGSATSNRTRNSLHLNVVGNPVVTTDMSGPIGSNHTTYGTGKYTFRLSTSFTAPLTYTAALGNVALTGTQKAYAGGVAASQGGSVDSLKSTFKVYGSLNSVQKTNAEEKDHFATTATASATTVVHGTYYHHAGSVATNGTSRTATGDAATTTNSTALVSAGSFDYLIIGAEPRMAPTVFSSVNTPVSLVTLYSTQLTAAHLEYQGQMLDQATMFPTWTYT